MIEKHVVYDTGGGDVAALKHDDRDGGTLTVGGYTRCRTFLVVKLNMFDIHSELHPRPRLTQKNKERYVVRRFSGEPYRAGLKLLRGLYHLERVQSHGRLMR